MGCSPGWRQARPEQLRVRSVRRCLIATRRFNQTWFTIALPVGKEADAVGAGHDLIEVVFQLRQGQVFVHVLAHIIRRHQIEGQAGDHPEPAQPDDRPRELSPCSSRDRTTTAPSAVTSSSADTAVARLPLSSPEPCVAVAQAPATEIWGNEARLGSA